MHERDDLADKIHKLDVRQTTIKEIIEESIENQKIVFNEQLDNQEK